MAAATRNDGLVLAGPFTTAFSAPTACQTAISAPGSAYIERDRACSTGTRFFTGTCYPPMLYTGALTADGPIVYNPAGTACPTGYSSVYDSTSANMKTLRCCPTPYSYSHSAFGPSASCYSRISFVGSSPVSLLGCLSTGLATVATLNASVTTPWIAWARVIQLETSVLSSATSSSISSSSSSSSSTSSTSPSPTDVTPSPKSGLPAGAIAGIVIGAVAFLALIIAGLFICFRKRKQRRAAEQNQSGTATYMHHAPGQPATETKYVPAPVPMEYTPGPEKGGYMPPNQAGMQQTHPHGSPTFMPAPHNTYNPTHASGSPDIVPAAPSSYGSPVSDRASTALPPYTVPHQGYSQDPSVAHNQGYDQAYHHIGTAQPAPTELESNTAAPRHGTSSPFQPVAQHK